MFYLDKIILRSKNMINLKKEMKNYIKKIRMKRKWGINMKFS